VHNGDGLRWAIDQAIRFHIRPQAEREANVSRIMSEAAESFPPVSMVEQYLDLYRNLLSLR
jgi:starch synthase